MANTTWVFDVDGTLSDPTHRRHHVAQKPKRWDRWNKGMADDAPHHDVIQFMHVGRQLGHNIVVSTGREEEYRPVTMDWLMRNGATLDAMYMRKNKDYRTDDIVKKEMLDQMRADGYDPVLVFDDRDRCVKLWRSEGIRCFQVAPGDF